MQLNNPKTNTSNLIKQTEQAKKKARRKLIGSIFMLFTALIILLNVTTKEKPIPINPKIIEISSNAQNPARTNASAPHAELAASGAIAASSPIKSTPALATISTASAPQGVGFRGGVLSRDNKKTAPSATLTPLTDVTPPPANETITASPKIISLTTGSKPTPEDILNGNTGSSQSTIYFVKASSFSCNFTSSLVTAK